MIAPAEKERVPSIPSAIQRRLLPPEALPSSSPTNPSSSDSRSSTASMARSAAMSASVTGEPSPFSDADTPSGDQAAAVTASAASTIRNASSRSCDIEDDPARADAQDQVPLTRR